MGSLIGLIRNALHVAKAKASRFERFINGEALGMFFFG